MIGMQDSRTSRRGRGKPRIPQNKPEDLCYFAKDICYALDDVDGKISTLNAVLTQPGVLAFIPIYSNRPDQNNRGSNTVYASTNLDLLLESDGTNPYEFNSPADLLLLGHAPISEEVFPVFASRNFGHRWTHFGTYNYLGQHRIRSITYLAPGVREERQNIRRTAIAQMAG